MPQTKPNWPSFAEELKRRYLKGEASEFVLHGNVHDLVFYEDTFYSLADFLSKIVLTPSREIIMQYNIYSGVKFVKKTFAISELEDLILEKSPTKILPAIEKILHNKKKVALIFEYAEMVLPVGDANFFSDSDRQSIVALHRWSMSPLIEQSDNMVLLVTENLSELNPKIVSNPKCATLHVPLPDSLTRAMVIEKIASKYDEAFKQRLVEVTAGLKNVQIKALLEPLPHGPDDPALQLERERFITALLGNTLSAETRAKKLAEITTGMSNEEIKNLVAPEAQSPADDEGKGDLLRLIYKRKREIIERECFGLIEFVDSQHDFSVVGGIAEIKNELQTIATNMREGRNSRCPMGLLFTGPMGTGKTFVAEAFVKETGLTAIKLKSFRSKWVGATEANLERILSVIKAMGQVIVIIDEGDRAFGNQASESDGGTSSRVIGRIKEFMSDTANRGRVLFILMTNRPDKLDVDIKRAGRLDKKIPFLYPQTTEEVEAVVKAQIKKNDFNSQVVFPQDRQAVSQKLVGYSNAEIEAVVLLAGEYAKEVVITAEHFTNAIRDYLPSRDTNMLEYMELIAVFEASNRKMLPAKYATIDVLELQKRLNELKLQVGYRR
ncbi:MAG: ATP-binding protein [Deltaproteobacteria bacterium]|nr:ATP-binding protein [Deltaproteobacteria bacterium]